MGVLMKEENRNNCAIGGRSGNDNLNNQLLCIRHFISIFWEYLQLCQLIIILPNLKIETEHHRNQVNHLK